MVESADTKPAASAKEAAQQACNGLQKSLYAWANLNKEEVPKANIVLASLHLQLLPVAPEASSSLSCLP